MHDGWWEFRCEVAVPRDLVWGQSSRSNPSLKIEEHPSVFVDLQCVESLLCRYALLLCEPMESYLSDRVEIVGCLYPSRKLGGVLTAIGEQHQLSALMLLHFANQPVAQELNDALKARPHIPDW